MLLWKRDLEEKKKVFENEVKFKKKEKKIKESRILPRQRCRLLSRVHPRTPIASAFSCHVRAARQRLRRLLLRPNRASRSHRITVPNLDTLSSKVKRTKCRYPATLSSFPIIFINSPKLVMPPKITIKPSRFAKAFDFDFHPIFPKWTAYNPRMQNMYPTDARNRLTLRYLRINYSNNPGTTLKQIQKLFLSKHSGSTVISVTY